MPPEPQPKTTSAAGQPSWMAPVQPIVPDHELIRRIGGGSYGDVWLARNVVGTWRAVKVVFRDRFTDARPYEREFNGMQKFEPLSRSNEGFVDILQIGRNDEAGYFYYVMELADQAGPGAKVVDSLAHASGTLSPTGGEARGEGVATPLDPETYVPLTLSKALLQRGRLPVNECLELGLTLNLALGHLHRAGLIHRDIKPSNIIFVGGVPKLADIGLVVETSEARSYVGTEGFIPPEGPTSPQADLYSLGKVLYEAGMGKDRKDFPEPFTQIAEAADSEQLLEFNAILLKACAANVMDRYQSAEQMNADLALLQGGGSVRQQRKLAGQLRFVQRAGVIVTVVAALVAAGWFWQAGQTRIVRGLADANSILANEKSRLADEKTKLANEKTKLAEENRERVVRLSIANGVRLMDADDLSGGLLWFAQALPLVTNKPAEESVHRIRIQQVLEEMPRLLQQVADDDSILASAFSPDGSRIAIGSRKGRLRVLDSLSSKLLLEQTNVGGGIAQITFTRDGQRLLISSAPLQGNIARPVPKFGFAAILNAQTGEPEFNTMSLDSEISSNIVFSAFSADDRWLAIAHNDKIIRVLDARDGHLVTRLEGHTNEIPMLTFSKDGTLLASASHDRTARVWRIPSGESAGPIILHDSPVTRAAFHPDGKRLVTAIAASAAASNTTVQVWNIQTGGLTGPPIQGATFSYALAYDDRGKYLLVNGSTSTGIWDADTHEPLYSLSSDKVVRSWAFSPDGSSLAIGFEGDGRASAWSLATGQLLFPWTRQNGRAESVHFSPDSKRLLTTSSDGMMRLWDLSRRRETASVELPPGQFSWDPSEWGKMPGLLPIRVGPAIYLLNPTTLDVEHGLVASQTNAPPYHYRAARSGRAWALYTFVSKRETNGIEAAVLDLWREEPTGLNHFVMVHPDRLRAIAFNADETELITECADCQVRVWRTSDGSLAQTLPKPPSRTGISDFLPDARRALFRREGDSFELIDLVSQKTLSLIPLPEFPGKADVSHETVDSNGARMALAGDEYFTIVDLANGRPITPILKHGGTIHRTSFSPDGSRLLTVGYSRTLKLWDTATGQVLLNPLPSAGSDAAWSPDGQFIASWEGKAGKAQVWDPMTTEAVTPVLNHRGFVYCGAITRNNRLLTASGPPTGAGPHLIRAWELAETKLSPEVVKEYACVVSGRKISASGALVSLSADELEQRFHALRKRAPQLFEVSK